jgi:hypothetical protein
MKRHPLLIVFICFFLTTCGDSVNSERSETNEGNEIATEASTKSSGIKVKNNIQLQPSGLQVSQAFLLYEDGALVPASNVTNVGRPVKLRLIIDGGWKNKDGNVYIGASEKIETSDGKVVLDEKDLFSHMPYISPEDAQYITLTATISGLDKLYDYFLVSFRVWDKIGQGEVTGSYKLYVQ